MKHFGDITKIDGSAVPIVDVVTGGSPCQDLSVAGRRAGLQGERSGLFMEQVRVVKEMRAHDMADGRPVFLVRPRFMVWENVPGAFSSNGGKDFQAVLQEICRIVCEEAPAVPVPQNGWPKSGCLSGVGDTGCTFSIAWRLHDAQFWGVPQRRKRIALVADFGGLSAPEILFERKGLSGDSEPSGETRETAAGAVGGGVESTEPIPIHDQATRFKGKHGERTDGKGNGLGVGNAGDPANTLSSADRHAVLVFKAQEECSPTLSAVASGTNQVNAVFARQRSDELAESEVASTQSARQYKDATDLVVTAVDCQNSTENAEKNGTLQSSAGHNLNINNVCRTGPIVRRLTPLECERLQGFPDGWTDIGEWTDSNGKKHKDADSPRYNALGNSIAMPFWEVLARRICAQYDRPVTMASLFDGIGGFPLAFSRCGATPVWASEIEEFPMAVTKIHFPEEAE